MTVSRSLVVGLCSPKSQREHIIILLTLGTCVNPLRQGETVANHWMIRNCNTRGVQFIRGVAGDGAVIGIIVIVINEGILHCGGVERMIKSSIFSKRVNGFDSRNLQAIYLTHSERERQWLWHVIASHSSHDYVGLTLNN